MNNRLVKVASKKNTSDLEPEDAELVLAMANGVAIINELHGGVIPHLDGDLIRTYIRSLEIVHCDRQYFVGFSHTHYTNEKDFAGWANFDKKL